jgi:hypothetical protein
MISPDATRHMAEAKTPQEVYADELEKLLASVDRLEEHAVRRAIALLTEARRRIIATLADVPEDSFLASYLPRLQAEIEAHMARYISEYQTFFTDQSRVFWDLGVAAVDRPLGAAGAMRMITQLPALEPRYVDLLQGFRTGLITGISDQAIQRITTELQLGVLGGRTPFEIQRSVTDILSTQRDAAGAFHGVAARAEAITRTELNRTFNMATASRQAQFEQRLATIVPEMTPRKRWLNAGDDRVRASHRRKALLDQRPAINEDFLVVDDDGARWRATGPHDPRLPASQSTNCRCRSIIDTDSIMSILEAA